MNAVNNAKEVYSLLRKIPKGRVTTYNELAKACELTAREVGKILAENPRPIEVPCPRVIKSNGELGGYTFKGRKNKGMKAGLLKREGIKIINQKIGKEFLFKF